MLQSMVNKLKFTKLFIIIGSIAYHSFYFSFFFIIFNCLFCILLCHSMFFCQDRIENQQVVEYVIQVK